jgi:hypothetical protein
LEKCIPLGESTGGVFAEAEAAKYPERAPERYDILIISIVTGRFIGSTASIGLYVKSRNLFRRRGGLMDATP